jgi:hypothetical protein
MIESAAKAGPAIAAGAIATLAALNAAAKSEKYGQYNKHLYKYAFNTNLLRLALSCRSLTLSYLLWHERHCSRKEAEQCGDSLHLA